MISPIQAFLKFQIVLINCNNSNSYTCFSLHCSGARNRWTRGSKSPMEEGGRLRECWGGGGGGKNYELRAIHTSILCLNSFGESNT